MTQSISQVIDVTFDVKESTLTKGLTQAQKIIDNFSKNNKIDVDFEVSKAAQKSLKNVADSMEDIGDSANDAEHETNELEGALKSVAGVDISKITTSLSGGLTFALKAAGIAAAAVTAAFVAMTAAIMPFVATASEFENFEAILRTLEGSSEAAARSMDWVTEFAKTTPYALAEVTDAFVKMKSYGIDPTAGALQTWGDAAAGMGKSLSQAVEAYADALMGENERLKEFGIKAKKEGETIAYAWTDSSGKARDIVIENNRDIIKSTLSAIMNDKYAGAMIAMSTTWTGLISNMGDSWNIFKADVMDKGLFDYFKGIALVISKYLNGAFDSALDSAQSWTDTIISGINSSIMAVGHFVDAWNGVKLAFKSIEVMFLALATGMRTVWDNLIYQFEYRAVGFHNAYKIVVDSIGKLWYDTVSYMSEIWAKLMNSIKGVGTTLAGYLGIDLSFDIDTTGIDTYKSAIEALPEPILKVSEETKLLQAATTEAYLEMDKLYESVANAEGAEGAASIINEITTAIEELNNVTGPDKAEGKAALDKLIKEANAKVKLADKTNKTINKNKAKTDKTAKKAKDKVDKQAVKDAKEAAKEVEDAYNDAFESIASGDVMGMFEGMGKDLVKSMGLDSMDTAFGKSLSSMLTQFLGFSNAMNAVVSASVWGLIFTVGMKMLQSLFSGGTVTEQERAEAEGANTIFSPTVENGIEILAENSNIGLKYSKQMAESLSSLVSLSFHAAAGVANVGVASGSSGTYGLTGEGYFAKEDLGFWNDSTTELVSIGIKIQSASLDEIAAGQLDASKYMTEQISDSGWLGLGSGTELKTTDLGDADAAIMEPIVEAYQKGTDAIRQAAIAFGYTNEMFTAELKDWETTLNNLNFKDKDQDEIANMISGAIGADLDNMAGMLSAVTPYLEEYNLAGEQQGTTLIRLVSDWETLDQVMGNLGISIGTITEGGVAFSQALIEASGSMQILMANLNGFIDNYFSTAEKEAFLRANLTKEMEILNMVMPQTREQYKAQVLALMAEEQQLAATTAANFQYMLSLEAVGGAAYNAAVQQYNAAKLLSDNAAKRTADMLSLQGDFDQLFPAMKSVSSASSGMAAAASKAAAAQEEAARAAEKAAEEARVLALNIDTVSYSMSLLGYSLSDISAETMMNAAGGINEFNSAMKVFVNGFFSDAEQIEMMTLDLTKTFSDFNQELPTTNAEFRELLESFDVTTIAGADLYGQVISLSKSFLDLTKATDAQEAANLKAAQTAIKSITTAWTSNLSYLTTQQKQDYAELAASQTSEILADSGMSASDLAKTAATYAMKAATTKEEYMPAFDRYITALEADAPEATLDDVLDELKRISEEVITLQDATTTASYR